MTAAENTEPTLQKPLRLWPGVVLVLLQWLAAFGLPRVWPQTGPWGAMLALLAGLAMVVWWAFFSRAPRWERWGGAVLMIVALAATRPLLHESVATGGMGVLFFFYAVPVLCLAFVLWAVAGRRFANGPRRVAMVATILVACGAWTLVRTGGVTGGGGSDFAWRWSETPEERLLAEAGDEPAVLTLPPAVEVPTEVPNEALSELPVEAPVEGPVEAAIEAPVEASVDWPGFRGPDRDGHVRAVRIETDWSASPPVELWRRPIGPGWSSFAVGGGLLYTQEQRGEDELVSCHDAGTGELVWRHRDTARFWESNAGAGPRATPTLSDGRVYTLGATGILNALDAASGVVVWSRNATSDTGAEIPGWGFSSSPLVVDDLVIVHAGTLVAYDRDTGDPRWLGPAGGSYSSPHMATIDGVAQILQLSGAGAAGVAPADGTLLWEHPWAGSIVQPALAGDGDLLISASGLAGGLGIRRIAVSRAGGLSANAELSGSGGWTAEERWTSARLKPNFSDFVVHQGHAFGFDGRILACIDVADGERKWKGGRYGSGQLVLLPDQDLLLVVSEKGELALVEAKPERFTELARVPALEGKTWNHPVLVDDLLLVRNGQEMAAYRLAPASG